MVYSKTVQLTWPVIKQEKPEKILELYDKFHIVMNFFKKKFKNVEVLLTGYTMKKIKTLRTSFVEQPEFIVILYRGTRYRIDKPIDLSIYLDDLAIFLGPCVITGENIPDLLIGKLSQDAVVYRYIIGDENTCKKLSKKSVTTIVKKVGKMKLPDEEEEKDNQCDCLNSLPRVRQMFNHIKDIFDQIKTETIAGREEVYRTNERLDEMEQRKLDKMEELTDEIKKFSNIYKELITLKSTVKEITTTTREQCKEITKANQEILEENKKMRHNIEMFCTTIDLYSRGTQSEIEKLDNTIKGIYKNTDSLKEDIRNISHILSPIETTLKAQKDDILYILHGNQQYIKEVTEMKTIIHDVRHVISEVKNQGEKLQTFYQAEKLGYLAGQNQLLVENTMQNNHAIANTTQMANNIVVEVAKNTQQIAQLQIDKEHIMNYISSQQDIVNLCYQFQDYIKKEPHKTEEIKQVYVNNMYTYLPPKLADLGYTDQKVANEIIKNLVPNFLQYLQ